MPRPRDSQRSKVYAAERAAFGWPDSEPEFTLAECEDYVEKVWRSVAVPDYHVARPPRVTDGRGARHAYSHGGRISLPRFGRRKWIILHELAHELTHGRFAPHGPEFVECYLGLVGKFLGFDVRMKLGGEFLKRRVKTRPKK